MNSVLLVANQVLFCKVPKRYEEDCLKLLSCYLTSPVMILLLSFGYGSTLAQNSKASQSKAPPNQKKKRTTTKRNILFIDTSKS